MAPSAFPLFTGTFFIRSKNPPPSIPFPNKFPLSSPIAPQNPSFPSIPQQNSSENGKKNENKIKTGHLKRTSGENDRSKINLKSFGEIKTLQSCTKILQYRPYFDFELSRLVKSPERDQRSSPAGFLEGNFSLPLCPLFLVLAFFKSFVYFSVENFRPTKKS